MSDQEKQPGIPPEDIVEGLKMLAGAFRDHLAAERRRAAAKRRLLVVILFALAIATAPMLLTGGWVHP